MAGVKLLTSDSESDGNLSDNDHEHMKTFQAEMPQDDNSVTPNKVPNRQHFIGLFKCSTKTLITLLMILCIFLLIGLLFALLLPKHCSVFDTTHHSSPMHTAMHFIHISDTHLDIYYNDTITKETGCRGIKLKGKNKNITISPAVAIFGRPGCDAPVRLLNAASDKIKLIQTESSSPIEFVLITGDQTAHSYKYFEVDMNSSVLWSIGNSTRILSQCLKNKPVIVTIGNNDLLGDYAPPVEAGDEFYKSFRRTIEPFMFVNEEFAKANPEKEFRKTFEIGGYYKAFVKGIVILALNTNYWLTKSHKINSAYVTIGNIQLQWFKEQLESAAASNQKVLIAGHVSPGCSAFKGSCNSWLLNYTQAYIELTTRNYSRVIVGQFFGHSHKDRLKVMSANDGTKSFLTIVPSITPVYKNNPSFRLVAYDTLKNQIVNYEQYYLDLILSNVYQRAIWYLGYSFLETYNLPFTAHSVERIVDNLIDPMLPHIWLAYSRNIASSSAHGASDINRFTEYCSSNCTYTDPFNKCMLKYKNSKA